MPLAEGRAGAGLACAQILANLVRFYQIWSGGSPLQPNSSARESLDAGPVDENTR
jgi:hypothetical protein